MAEETFENIEEVRTTDGSEKTVGIENLKVLENTGETFESSLFSAGSVISSSPIGEIRD